LSLLARWGYHWAGLPAEAEFQNMRMLLQWLLAWLGLLRSVMAQERKERQQFKMNQIMSFEALLYCCSYKITFYGA
jgi:hypothetical protein